MQQNTSTVHEYINQETKFLVFCTSLQSCALCMQLVSDAFYSTYLLVVAMDSSFVLYGCFCVNYDGDMACCSDDMHPK